MEYQLRIPERVSETLQKVAASQSMPMEFWQCDDMNRIIDCFAELAPQLTISGLNLSTLPKGYLLVALLFQWENECQFEGWNAFEWTPDITQVIDAYSSVGLPAESRAIARAAAAWKMTPQDDDAISVAYAQGENEKTTDIERLEYLAAYFCERADEMFFEG